MSSEYCEPEAGGEETEEGISSKFSTNVCLQLYARTRNLRLSLVVMILET